MIFVDTNYFLRFLLKDNTQQQKQAKTLFEQGALGEIKLFTSVIVFFEIYWILFSFYKKDKSELVKILHNVLSLSFIRFENSDILTEALKSYEKNKLDLEDSYNLVYAKLQKAIDFKTFDQKVKAFL